MNPIGSRILIQCPDCGTIQQTDTKSFDIELIKKGQCLLHCVHCKKTNITYFGCIRTIENTESEW